MVFDNKSVSQSVSQSVSERMSECIRLKIDECPESATPKQFEIITKDFNVSFVAYVPLCLPIVRTMCQLGHYL